MTAIANLNDMVASELVAATIYNTARSARPGAALVAMDAWSGSNIKSFTRFAKVTAGALVEANDGTATDMTDTQVSCTLGEIGIGTLLKDTVTVSASVQDIAQKIAVELGEAFADKVDIDVLANSATLTDQVGTTNTELTEDVWLSGIYKTEENDIGGRPLVFIGHPKQVSNLRLAFAGTTENTSHILGRPDMLSALAPADVNGFSFRYLGIDVFQSSNCLAANTTTDWRGMFLVPGMDAPILLGIGMLPDGSLWFGRREIERDASHRATELWVTGYVSTCVPAPERGCGVLSKQ